MQDELGKQIQAHEKRISELEKNAHSNFEIVKEKCKTVYFTVGMILVVATGWIIYLSHLLILR